MAVSGWCHRAFLGMLPAVWLLFQFGAERGIKTIAFIVPVATFTTGLIIGLVKSQTGLEVGARAWLPLVGRP